MLTENLTPADIQDFLRRLSTAIELDQVNVDALPPESFSIDYDDNMWRTWRQDHRAFIEKLLSTADAIPPVVLKQMTEIATAYEPAHVGSILQGLFAEVVSGSSAEDLTTATAFFSALTKEMSGQREGAPRQRSAQASILRWLSPTDPLRIAQDPEVGRGPSQVRHLDVARLRRA
ncbi:hypothetical protein [Bradyrhizobium sp. CCBAU 53421]|uniref:hypothetical protein n=1 Tax=Bradyrhizobium sp. CCBAU 53421 TaxID=1325120 RepID=UPI00188CD6E7|nr:hypothetical protein [Bradyrhizobium sp. CCBAU 53421]QOZ33285.1 hypothetical protein XH92_17745 [Bradyrhizobium sp. CCBAU 53421]